MTLALPALYAAVVAQFAADNSPIPQYFGWREPTKQSRSTVGRITWTPGNTSGDAGKFGPPVRPGRRPERPLATLLEAFTVNIYAANTDDKGAAVDELAQYNAARCLLDYWYRTVYNAGYAIGSGARIVLTELVWVGDNKERPHGACLRATMTIEAAVLDAPLGLIVPTGPSAVLDTGIDATDSGAITTDDGEVTIAADPTIP